MPELLTIGPPTAITQNTVYALPSRRCLLFTDGTTPTITHSTTVGFSASAAVTLTGGAAEVGGGFIKCTSGNINVVLSRM